MNLQLVVALTLHVKCHLIRRLAEPVICGYFPSNRYVTNIISNRVFNTHSGSYCGNTVQVICFIDSFILYSCYTVVFRFADNVQPGNIPLLCSFATFADSLLFSAFFRCRFYCYFPFAPLMTQCCSFRLFTSGTCCRLCTSRCNPVMSQRLTFRLFTDLTGCRLCTGRRHPLMFTDKIYSNRIFILCSIFCSDSIND